MNDVPDTYLHESTYRQDAAGGHLVLETAAGLTPAGLVAHPVFFSGRLAHPEVAAAGLRCLVEVASTRYFNPIPGGFASLDPVVTAQGDRLRCEAFSACNGVYARLDLLGESFDEAALGFGTTNIDINPVLAFALAGLRAQDHLHLNVGPEQILFDTPAGTHTEHRVKLPERWVRGLGETQALAAALEPRVRLDAAGWRRFINSLSMGGGSGAGVKLWLLPGAAGLRQTTRPQPGAISLAGTARLAAIKRLQHLVQAVSIYSPPVEATTQAAISAWEFQLPGARLTLMLSPEPYRGFSGEGAMLQAIGQAERADAQTLASLLAWEAHIDEAALADEMGVPQSRIHHGLQLLASGGQVGFDLAEQGYFHRQLPYTENRLEKNYPRLVAAREILAAGGVVRDGERYRIRCEDHYHWVRFEGERPACTCHFWVKYAGSRGPCKHILAAQLLRAQGEQG